MAQEYSSSVPSNNTSQNKNDDLFSIIVSLLVFVIFFGGVLYLIYSGIKRFLNLPFIIFIIEHLFHKKELQFTKELKNILLHQKLDIESELNTLLSKYNIQVSQKSKIINKKINEALQYYYFSIISDRRVQEAEEKSFDKVCQVLNYSSNSFKDTKFHTFKILDNLDKNIIPILDIQKTPLNIILQANEILHYIIPAETLKRKMRTTRINYSGVTTSIKIAKGLYYKAGSISPNVIREEYLNSEDNGYIFITDKHIGFKGNRSIQLIEIKKIISINFNNEGMQIYRKGREKPFMFYMNEYEVTAQLLSILINNLPEK